MILVAHPDDETLACGGEMIHWPDCVIAHITDGSPRAASFAHAAGFATREAYADARRSELLCALSKVGGRKTRTFGLTDQESWRDLIWLSHKVTELMDEIKPTAVMTHPYEGGHPDHDAAAFAVQHACKSLGPHPPVRIEAAFYNRLAGIFRTNEFLPGPPITEVELDEAARLRKQDMFACFASQQSVLSAFSTSIERYRAAPHYIFTEPPHPGPLNYETLGWGITSAMWIEAASQAILRLGA